MSESVYQNFLLLQSPMAREGRLGQLATSCSLKELYKVNELGVLDLTPVPEASSGSRCCSGASFTKNLLEGG